MLSRKLADTAHYPAIDLNGSISRLMQSLLSSEDLKMSNKLRRLWSLYQQNEDLIKWGPMRRARAQKSMRPFGCMSASSIFCGKTCTLGRITKVPAKSCANCWQPLDEMTP